MSDEVWNAYQAVIDRSEGMCEAMVLVNGSVWTRCGKRNGQIHHMLKRGRGGELLDDVKETYHLMVLCQRHHMYAEESGEDTGMLIDGYVVSGVDGRPVYTGSDRYLTEVYGRDDGQGQNHS